MHKVFQERGTKVLLLQDIVTKTHKVQKQGKRKASSQKEKMDYAFSYQCPNCNNYHKGSVQSDSDQLQIECLEPLHEMAVSDDGFLLWLAYKQKGKTPLCHFIHSVAGRQQQRRGGGGGVKEKQGEGEEEGLHQLYDGRYDEEMIRLLEERAKKRSMYL